VSKGLFQGSLNPMSLFFGAKGLFHGRILESQGKLLGVEEPFLGTKGLLLNNFLVCH